MFKLLPDGVSDEDAQSVLDEICRQGAARMLVVALEAEVEDYVARHSGDLDDDGHRLVVRNGRGKRRQVTTVSGTIEVRAPRVDDRRTHPETGERRRFVSAILPPWCRRSPKVAEVLPLLYLHGLSTKDFLPALEEFFGASAGLSASVVTRLAKAFEEDLATFMARDLSGVDYVYCWVDGVVRHEAPSDRVG
jgi:putative transposase